MTVFNILWLVSCLLFAASATIEIIAYYKKNKLMEYIGKPCMYVFMMLSSLFVLIPLIPDSINIIVYESIAVACALAGACVLFIPKRKRVVAISSILFIAGNFSYLKLINPSFRLFSLPVALTVIISLIYISGLILYYIYAIGRKNVAKTAGTFAFFFPILVMHYGSILTMCGQFKLYSVILFLGCTVLAVSQAFIVKGFFHKASEKERLARMILYIASQTLITAGFTLMVAL